MGVVRNFDDFFPHSMCWLPRNYYERHFSNLSNIFTTFIMLRSISLYNFKINCERFCFFNTTYIYTFGDISQKPVIFTKKNQHNASKDNYIWCYKHYFHNNIISNRQMTLKWRFEIRGNMFSLFSRILLSPRFTNQNTDRGFENVELEAYNHHK